jgi:hypothetical protein
LAFASFEESRAPKGKKHTEYMLPRERMCIITTISMVMSLPKYHLWKYRRIIITILTFCAQNKSSKKYSCLEMSIKKSSKNTCKSRLKKEKNSNIKKTIKRM